MPSEEAATATPAQPITELDPAWDISRLATRGHVLTERAFAITREGFWPVFLLGLIGGLLLLQGALGVVISHLPATNDAGLINIAASALVLTVFTGVMLKVMTGGEGLGLDAMGNAVAFCLGIVVFGVIGFIGQNVLPSIRTLTFILAVGGGLGFVAYGTWKGITTRDHVRGLLRGTAIVAVAIVLSWIGGVLSNPSAGIASLARGFLTYNPSTYFDLGGGLRGGPQFAWMSAYGPKPESLTVAQYAALTKAVTTDIRAHGLDVQAWTATAELTPAPTITRAAKVINQYAGNLKSGVIIIPEGYGALSIVAHVEGQWSVTQFGGGGACATVFGPASDESGCQKQTAIQAGESSDAPFNRYASEVLRSIRPHTTEE